MDPYLVASIDPGSKGGLCLFRVSLNEKKVTLEASFRFDFRSDDRFPKKRREDCFYNSREMFCFLKEKKPLFIICEDLRVGGYFGGKTTIRSNSSLSFFCGLTEGIGLGIAAQTIFIKPVKWQKYAKGLAEKFGETDISKKSYKDRKKIYMNLASFLSGKEISHDGMGDSFLLGYFDLIAESDCVFEVQR